MLNLKYLQIPKFNIVKFTILNSFLNQNKRNVYTERANEFKSPSKMIYNKLGKSGLIVSGLSLGAWLTYGGQVDDTRTYECMKKSFEYGCNFFDNAEIYSDGNAEISQGKALKKLGWRREDFVISTKLYWGKTRSLNDVGLSRKHLIEGMKSSLQRLQLDYVDIVYCHRYDLNTPLQEVIRGMNYLIEKGYALYWGTSEWSKEQLEETFLLCEKLNLIPPSTEQAEYNLFHRERVEKEYLNLYTKYGLGNTIWSPLAGGILTGKYIDNIPPKSRLSGENLPKSYAQRFSNITNELHSTDSGKKKLKILSNLKQLAEKKIGCSLTQLSLGWCLKNQNVSSVITGATSVRQIEENFGTLDIIPKLNADVMSVINSIINIKE